MTLISAVKDAEIKWTPLLIFDVVLKDGTPRYWAMQSVTFGVNPYTATVLSHSGCKVEGPGIYGVDSVGEISLTLNNADKALDSIITPANLQGGTVQPRLIFVDPDTGTATTDSVVFGTFLFDLPSEVWPTVVVRAHNKMNMTRKNLPVSVITRKDRYPFPSTAAERHLAGNHPESEFFALGYDPDNSKGNYLFSELAITGTTGSSIKIAGTTYSALTPGFELSFIGKTQWRATTTITVSGSDTIFTVAPAFDPAPLVGDMIYGYYSADLYNGTRDTPDTGDGTFSLSAIGLSARFGGFGKIPPTLAYSPKKGESQEFKGSANEGKIGQAVPLIFGTCRTQPIVLHTLAGNTSGERLACYLVADGVNFSTSKVTYGIKSIKRFWLPNADRGRSYEIFGYAAYCGYLGSQVPNVDAYRNIIPGTDFNSTIDDNNRDLYSGLAYVGVMIPRAFADPSSDVGPTVECLAEGLRVETWDHALNITWQWSDNPIWILVHLLKLLRWTTADMDMDCIYHSAAYCDTVVASGKKRFRCNLALTSTQKAADILRGIRNNCRAYTAFGADGKLQIKIEKDFATEGSSFTLDATNIVRDASGNVMVKKFYKSIYESANCYSVNFQDEDNSYVSDSLTKLDLDNIAQIDEKISGDSITALLGIPSYDQADRQLNWIKVKNIDCNEFYSVRTTTYACQLQVGQVGTITDTRNGLAAQQCRLLSIQVGSSGTVDLLLQKHSDAAYSDTSPPAPLVRIKNDSTYSPRSASGTGAGGIPVLTELFIQNDVNLDSFERRIQVDFKVPNYILDTSFSRRTVAKDLAVSTTGGSITGNQVLYVEVCPYNSGRGAPSDTLYANIPAGTNTNKITFTCQLPAEATFYDVFVGSYPGRTFRLEHTATPGTAEFTVTITSLASIEVSELVPDPGFDHVRILYKYESGVLIDAGQTTDVTKDEYTFVPEPSGSATTITVYVISANARETDFYPLAAAPYATLTLTKDTGQPSGCSNLVILTYEDDPLIPKGTMQFQFDRDTSNWESIYAVEVALHTVTPMQGPYAAQRAAFPAHTFYTPAEGETPTQITAGKFTVATCATDLTGKVLLVYTTGDTGLDGQIVKSHAGSTSTLTTPFYKTGLYSWVAVDRWFDIGTAESDNTWEHTFWCPMDMMVCGVNTTWRTKPVPLITGSYYAQVYTRNKFGVSQ